MRFWYTKFLMRFMALLAFLGFAGVLYYAYITTINEEDPPVSAPFREDLSGLSQNPVVRKMEENLTLREAHRSEKELKSWITKAVSESLFIPNRDYQNVLFQSDKYFTDAGFKEYEAYLVQSKIPDYVETGTYSLNVVVDEMPVLLNNQSVDGAYRWLFQVPITISFVPNNLTTGETVNQKLMLRLQLRRVETPNNPDVVKIENWLMRARG